MSEERARHSIGVAETRTGLSAHTLRAWEKRYGAVEPDRTEGGHRLYSDEQIRRLGVLGRLTERGHRISHVADLPTDELVSLLETTVEESRGSSGTRTGREGGPRVEAWGSDGDDRAVSEAASELERELFDAIRDYDADRLENAFRRGALELSARVLIEDVVAPLLRRVGEAWREGEVSPGQEHLLSGVVMRTLGWILDSYRTPPGAPKIVVATPVGQRHNLGALLAAATAASIGWETVYLGGDLPAGEIAEAANGTEARAVALSIVYPEDDPELASELRTLAERLPSGTPLLVGGASAGAYGAVLEEVGARRLAGYAELRGALAGLAS